MTIRSLNDASPACATTMARLDDSITVAHTNTSTMLLNMPRSIDELEEATQSQGFFTKFKNLFA
ncbi:hypothetical protein QP027_10905 [Corynebacterium breve]|uniref:Uncharacterized protein n=1 Tax=Corynebacterium breve TaxID=3049799 RepID=A0ABY8VEQ4_9CORY|nr:hypothetical protein [Corynebacterium breve]WIM67582.1 hypothetical protein QP027_10905 [Corynebacterium breve]